MKKEEALRLSESALSDLAEALKAGHSETLVEYLRFLARFHNYSFGNMMMIRHQRPEATHVAGFSAWKKLGRNVKKGEKGIAILAPVFSKRSMSDFVEEAPDTEFLTVLSGFRVVHVFDVSQTDGKTLPQFAGVRGDPGYHLETLRKLIADEGIALEYEHIPNGAIGVSSGGKIVVLPGLGPAEEFAVLAHELAHELLHKGERRSATSNAVRETEAEAVSFVISTAIGLDTSTRSSDYIQLHRGDVETLSESLEHIQIAATRILSALEVLCESASGAEHAN